VKAYREKAKKAASYYSEGTYTGARWIVEAIKAIMAMWKIKPKLMDALRKWNSGTFLGVLSSWMPTEIRFKMSTSGR